MKNALMVVLTAALLVAVPGAVLAVGADDTADTTSAWGSVPLYADPSAFSGSAPAAQLDDFAAAIADGEGFFQDASARATATNALYVEDEVLVVTSPDAGGTQGLASLQSVDEVEPLQGESDVVLVSLDEGVSVEQAIETLEDVAGVEHVQPNYLYSLAGGKFPNDPGLPLQWGLHNTGQFEGGLAGADISGPEAWEIDSGSDRTVVMVIDTGIDPSHADLQGNVWTNRREIPDNGKDDDGNGYIDDIYGFDFHRDRGAVTDNIGHGTHVAGIVGAQGNNGYGVTGTSWDVSVMTAKVDTEDGFVDTAGAIEAIGYADKMGAEIANCSWGTLAFDPALKSKMAASPMLFACSSGNDGVDNDSVPMYPASYDLPNIIAVASTGMTDVLSSFSNYGATSVDLAAPGEGILSTVPHPQRMAIFRDDFHSTSRWDTSKYWQRPWKLTDTQYVSAARSLAQASPRPTEWAWAVLRDPISLADAEAPAITVDVRSDMVKNDDYLYLWIGDDSGMGAPFVLDEFNDEWITYVVDLTGFPTSSKLHVALVYAADTARSAPPGAVYIDDVRVYPKTPWLPWDFMDGTSMSAPHVAGAAALVKSRNSALSADQVKGLLLANTDALDSLTGKVVTGGRLNAGTALAATPAPTKTVDVKRIAGKDRFAVSASIAKQVFYDDDTSWVGTKDIIIASGDDRAAADPLSAAGLSWVLDAPVFLIGANHSPASVKESIRQITAANGEVTVHIVGGEKSLPWSRIKDVLAPAQAVGTVKMGSRYGVGVDRFGAAAQVAARVRAEWQVRDGKNPPVALVANGADANTFFDALALSPVAAKKGFPILLTQSKAIPRATSSELGTMKPDNVYVAGGYKTVSPDTLTKLGALSKNGAERWGGLTRYDTAVVIADEAVDRGWLHTDKAMVVAKLPDALTGGSMLGRSGAPLFVTAPGDLPKAPSLWLIDMAKGMDTCYLLGGTASVKPAVESRVRSILQ